MIIDCENASGFFFSSFALRLTAMTFLSQVNPLHGHCLTVTKKYHWYFKTYKKSLVVALFFSPRSGETKEKKQRRKNHAKTEGQARTQRDERAAKSNPPQPPRSAALLLHFQAFSLRSLQFHRRQHSTAQHTQKESRITVFPHSSSSSITEVYFGLIIG